MKKQNYIFSLFLIICTISLGMERPRRQGEYTIVEFSNNKKKMYQVVLNVGSKIGFVGCKRTTFEDTLEDLQDSLYYDPAMTGDSRELIRFSSSSGDLGKEVEDKSQLEKIKLAYQDEIFLMRKELSEKAAQYDESTFIRGAAILQKLSKMNCSFVKVGSRKYISVYPLQWGSASRFQALERYGAIACIYDSSVIATTDFDIDRLEYLVKEGWTLTLFQKLKKTFPREERKS